MTNASTANPSAPGVMTQKNPNGRKHHFMCGGPTLHQARYYIAWERATPGFTFWWHGDGRVVQLTRPDDYRPGCVPPTDPAILAARVAALG